MVKYFNNNSSNNKDDYSIKMDKDFNNNNNNNNRWLGSHDMLKNVLQNLWNYLKLSALKRSNICDFRMKWKKNGFELRKEPT